MLFYFLLMIGMCVCNCLGGKGIASLLIFHFILFYFFLSLSLSVCVTVCYVN